MPPDLSVDSIDAQRVSDRALSKAAPANGEAQPTNPALARGARRFAQPQSAFPNDDAGMGMVRLDPFVR